ncbi:MAG: hypothetical protein M1833_001380 [Piccolia ochrophora]|nr:MAG: hypothetical protein M1833_001380 [Piccolia ochrophora]
MPLSLDQIIPQTETNTNTIPVPFPGQTKQAASIIDGIHTDVMSIAFADKIMITVTQAGRLAQWVHVPLNSSNPNFADHQLPADGDEGGLLPMSHLTPTTILGGTGTERETMGQLFATQIASTIATKNPEENRMVVLGLGLEKATRSRETFFDVVELVMQVI